MKIKSAGDFDIFKRLDEIDGELQDFHISAYKCDLLYKEQNNLKAELRQRGYKINPDGKEKGTNNNLLAKTSFDKFKYTQNEKERTLHIWIPLFEEKLDNQHFFCEQPHMYLIVWNKWDSKKKCNKLWAKLGIGDLDDFDYTCEFEHPTPELIHEVINWMLDHEYAIISDMDDVIKIVDAFQNVNGHKEKMSKRCKHE